MRSQCQVLVELTPEQVVLSLVNRGQAGETRVARLTARVEGRIVTAVATYTEALSRLVMESGSQDMRAMVLFTSPDAGAGVFSCARRAGEAAAERAALLALGEATSLDVVEEPHAVITLATDDRDAEGVPQVHKLGIAVADGELEAVSEIVEGAGLQFAGAMPSTGLGMLSAVSAAVPASADGVRILLHMGERDSTIVGATQGRMRFVRQAPIGLESLVEVLTRDPILDVSDTPHRLTREEARALLFAQGIPLPGQGVEVTPKVQSKAVLPLLQSTLQRLALEVKQSTRFGLSEGDRAKAVLSISGVGAKVRRLESLISEMSGFSDLSEANSDADKKMPTDLQVWSDLPELSLFPREVMKQRVARDLQRRFLVGAALAIAALGLTWGKMRYDIKSATDEIAVLATPHESETRSQLLADQVRAANIALAAAKDSLHAASPTRVRVQGLLLSLATASSRQVRLTNVEVDANDGGGVARISGVVLSEAGKDGAFMLGKFIDQLSGTPVVRNCKLASTRRGTGQDEGSIFFEMSVEVVRLPGSSMLAIDEPWEEGK